MFFANGLCFESLIDPGEIEGDRLIVRVVTCDGFQSLSGPIPVGMFGKKLGPFAIGGWSGGGIFNQV